MIQSQSHSQCGDPRFLAYAICVCIALLASIAQHHQTSRRIDALESACARDN